MNSDLPFVNDSQRAAIEWSNGPLLVLAGPGSGKTLVLTQRIARLLGESSTRRFRILALTFTNKAAAEMRTRVLSLVPNDEGRVLLTTFHSFAAELLRQHGSHLGLKPDFAILNQEEDRIAVLQDAIRVLRVGRADIADEDIKYLSIIDRLLARCVGEDQIAGLVAKADLADKLTALYTEYRRQLIDNNRLDFASLLFYTEQLLREQPMIARQLRITYPYVCVDEFQDTNLAQYRLLRALVGDDFPNLFVVADDDQIIYQWNGASPERLRSLRDDYKMTVIQLPANYRCPPEVIQLANHLIEHNRNRVAEKQPLYATKVSEADPIRVHSLGTESEEAAWVAEDIRQNRVGETGECVVLARRRRLLDLVMLALESHGVKAASGVRKNEFVSAPLRWLHATLRLANARSDREQVRRLCGAFYELCGVATEAEEIIAFAPAHGNDYLRTWLQTVRKAPDLPTPTTTMLAAMEDEIVDRLEVLRFCQTGFVWIDALAQGEQAARLHPDYAEEKQTWVNLQQQVVHKYRAGSVTLNLFLQEFDLAEKSTPAPPDAVRCMTIHSAKGMEFEHVYLVGLVEDELPAFRAIQKGPSSREMEEERRSCFVAITRARRTLTLTYATRYFGWPKKASRFLEEMGLLV